MLRPFRLPTTNRQGRSPKAKCMIQRECTIMLKKQIPPVLPCLRRRLERWNLDIPVGHRADRAVAALREAWACTPPRVAVTLLYTLLNGWSTLRRFQQQGRCRLCNLQKAADSFEHLPYCSIVQWVATHLFRLPHSSAVSHREHMANFLCLSGTTGSHLQTRLLFLRVVYMLYYHAKHQGGIADAKSALHLSRSLLLRAASGHPVSAVANALLSDHRRPLPRTRRVRRRST